MNDLIRSGMVAACVLGVGCGDDDGGGGVGNLAQFEGIYTITSHTQNTMGCEAPGESILDREDPMLAGIEVTFFFVPVLTVQTCVDLEDCRAVATDAQVNNTIPFFGGFIFEGANGNVATGRTSIASKDFSTGQCNGTLIRHTLTAADDGSITLQTRTTETPAFAPDANDQCLTEDADAAGEGQPCTELITIHADLTETL